MTQQLIDLGTGSPSRLSESIRSAFTKVNSNFTEIFTACGPGGNAVTYSNSISSTASLINLGVGDALTNGDTLRAAFTKIVNNFNTLFAVVPISHYNIDLGDGPNTQTGDTVTSAFQKINADFTNLYTTLGLTVSNAAVNTTDFGPSYRNRLTIETVSSEYILPIVTEPFGYYGAGQQFINLGDGPDTQTGDTVREAFIKINANFSDLYQVFGANGETNLIGNTIIANNINVTDTVRAGGFFGYGNVETDGNIIGSNFLYPNGISVFSNLTADYTHIPSNMIPTANNSFTIGNASLQWASVNAGYYFGNGRYLSGIDTTLISNGNSNVKAYYNANVGITANGTTWTFDPGGTLTFPTGSLIQNGYPGPAGGSGTGDTWFVSSNVGGGIASPDGKQYVQVDNNGPIYIGTNFTANTGKTWVFGQDGNLTLPGNLITSSNVVANYFQGNGRYLTGIDATLISNGTSNVKVYSNANVTISIANVANVVSIGSTSTTITGDLGITGNVTANNLFGNLTQLYNTGYTATLSSTGQLSAYYIQASSGYFTSPYGIAFTYAGDTNQQFGWTIVNADALALKSTISSTLDTTILTFNRTTGNLSLTGNSYTTGNVTGNYFFGNGRYLTGIDATSIQNGTSNVKVYSNANVTISIANLANIVSIGSTGTTITGTLGVSGNIVAANFTGNVSGNIAAPGANTQVLFNDSGTVNATSGFTFDKATNLVSITGNLTSNALTINNSVTVGSTLRAAAGIQNTPIGNIAGQASTGSFTTITANGNLTVAGITSNGAITATTIGAATIGNTNATHVGGSYYASGNYYGIIGSAGFANAATVTTLSANGNATVNGLTVNTSGVFTTTLRAAGGLQNTPVGNGTSSSGAFTTLSASSLSVSGNAIVGNLDVLGNVTYINSTITTIVDPIIELNTGANGAPLSGSAPYDSGLKTHYWDGTADRQSFFGRTNAAGNFEYYSNVISESGNVVTGTYGTIKTGNLTLTGTATIASTLTVQSNITANAITVNNSATIGGTLGVVGNLIAGNLSATNFIGNAITLGTNTAGQLVSNAVTLTSGTSITNSIAQLNYVLGKLVPTAPNNFPGGQSLTISTLSTYRMANFIQTDNTATGGKSVAGGTSVSNVRRATTYTTSTIANVGPGDSGVVTAYRNGVAVGNVTLIAGNVSGTYGNLIITRSGDYANVSNVTPGFWYSFSSSLSGNVIAGWNEVYIAHSTTANTNIPYWYYDSSAPGTPTWSNTNISMTTNSSTYSSTIPHLNSGSAFTLTGNVAKLSGDMFPSGASSNAYAFVTGSAGGALAAPTSVTYAGANVTWPLAQNLYVSSGSAYLSTTAAVISGFGSSSTGPSLTADNSYFTGAATFSPGVTILYKTGTSTQIEETSITVTSVGTGSGNALRVINPGSTDTPVISANTAFNSQTSTLQTYDTTVVAAILKHDQVNYATGYLPVGPNLSSGRTGDQYFTFRFTRTVVSKFDISITGNVAGCFVALPGSTIDSTSTLNGWIDMSVAYAGSGVPGANIGAGGNGSNGCALGGVFTTNSSSTQSKTCTFGTVSSSSTVSNEIFVRLRLVSGQTVTALSIVTATH